MTHDQQRPHESEVSATTVQLNHTVVYARDRRLSAEFVAAILGLEVGAFDDPDGHNMEIMARPYARP